MYEMAGRGGGIIGFQPHESCIVSLLMFWCICFLHFKFAFYFTVRDVSCISTLGLGNVAGAIDGLHHLSYAVYVDANDQWNWELQLVYTVIN